MPDDSVYADLLDSLSPLTKAGIDPDQARIDRTGTMAKLLGTDVAAPPSWVDQAKSAQPTETAPAVPAGVTPSGNTTGAPSWADLQRQNVTKGMASLDKGDASLQAMQDQPDLGSQTATLEAQRAKDAAPINAYDPQTGKVLDQYKPSFGQRLMRGVEGFARGGILGVIDPAVGGATPYGAPNKQLGRDTAMQQGRVASDDQQLSNAAANWKAINDRAAAAAKETRSQAESRKGIATEITNQEKVPIEQQNADTAARKVDDKPDATPKTYEQAVIAANQETDPTKKAQLMAAADQIQKAEVRRFQATAPRGSAANAPVPEPTGPISPAAKAIIEGRSKLPPANSRNPDAQMVRKEVFANAPDYDETAYPTYAKTRAAFTAGTEGVGLNFIKTARGHLNELEQHIPDNVDIPVIGSLINSAKNAMTRSTSPQLKAFEAARNAVTAEVAKAYAGKAVTQGEHDDMLKLINESDSPKALRASIEEFRKLLSGKEQGYREQWNSGMPKGAVMPLSTLEPDAADGGFDWNAHPEAK